jgi:tRNA nucleotidyltransferase (CCA-adding enzyme)
LPKHPGHEKRSVRLVNALSSRMPVPVAYRELGVLVAEFHAHCHRAFELKPTTLLRVLQRIDAFRRPDRFERFLLACEADARGRTGFEKSPYPQAQYFRGAFETAMAVSGADYSGKELSGGEIGELVSKARLAALKEYKQASIQVPIK